MNEALVDWRVFAAWVETEGSVNSAVCFRRFKKTGTYYANVARAILIPQKERAPLAALQRFLHQHGIYSKIQLIAPSDTAYGRDPYFRLAIQRVRDVDQVIDRIRCHLLTSKTLYQIEMYSHTRHMTSAQLRAEFLQGWLEDRKKGRRRGGKGIGVY